MDSTIHEVKTKVLISSAVTAQLICTFVFTYAKNYITLVATHVMKIRSIFKTYARCGLIKSCEKKWARTGPALS